jgi:hypothetical protein
MLPEMVVLVAVLLPQVERRLPQELEILHQLLQVKEAMEAQQPQEVAAVAVAVQVQLARMGLQILVAMVVLEQHQLLVVRP